MSLYQPWGSNPIGVTDPSGNAVQRHSPVRMGPFSVMSTQELDFSDQHTCTEWGNLSDAARYAVGRTAYERIMGQFSQNQDKLDVIRWDTPTELQQELMQRARERPMVFPAKESAGKAGFIYGYTIKASLTPKGCCDLTGTHFRFRSFAVAWCKMASGRHARIYVGDAGDVRSSVAPATMEHELWHTEGVPQEVIRTIRNAGYRWKTTGDDERCAGRNNCPFIGFTGMTNYRVGLAHAALANVRFNSKPAGAAEGKWSELRPKDGKWTAELCESMAKAILDEYLTGDDARSAVEGAGYWHNRACDQFSDLLEGR